MEILDPNFRDLLQSFNLANVRYLVVGGYAVNFHGHHRNTYDFDVWLAVDGDNPARVSEALQEFGFPAESVRVELFNAKGPIRIFGRPPIRFDLLSDPSGVDFDECYERRVEGTIDGVRVCWIALEDLIANKRASARAKDRADLESLLELSAVKKGKTAKKRRGRKK